MCGLGGGGGGGGLVISDFFFKKKPIFFWGGGGGIFFYKLTRNPNLTFFLLGGGGGGGGGEGGVSVCAWTNVSNGISTLQGEHLCKIILESMHIWRSYGPEKDIYVTFKCDLDLQPT